MFRNADRRPLADLLLVVLLALFAPAVGRADAAPVLPRLLDEVAPGELVAGAEAYGPIRADVPVAPLLKGGETLGWVYVTSDFVGTIGYSGKPIHVMAAIGPDAKLLGASLVEHSEPIVLVGIPESRIKGLTESYVGLDLVAEAAAGGEAHEIDIISGATVTVMVIDDSVVRSGLKVARALGLGGLVPEAPTAGPRREIDPEAKAPESWADLVGEGAVRRFNLDIGQINRAFEAQGDPRAAARPEKGDPAETFIDMYAALVSVPAIGKALLGEADYARLTEWLKPGEHAILVAARGRYSFKGSGYVRGGIFDRIQLIQGDRSVRFRDRQHRRLGQLVAPDAPSLAEMDLFKIPANAGFDPAEPWRLQLLVHRAVGAIEKAFLTFDFNYRLPTSYLRPVATEAGEPSPALAAAREDERAAKERLWKRIWWQKGYEIAGLLTMLGTLTAVFFFQMFVTRSEQFTFWFRVGFLTLTLVFLGWYANAQLSVVNLMALASALATDFTWDAFLIEPLTFILWFSVAAALLFWGRGAYCGWLCPFGALQELLNRLAKLLHIPQWTVPWGLNERLWALKYMIFLGLFGLSLVSLPLAERYAEVEPFKTAIVLKFARSWPYVLFAVALLVAGLFVERFYCRYLCPLGAALAIPARLRMFDWLRRYPECGRPCQTCANECMVQAIHPTGEINPNECLTCLNCQVLYQSESKCPVVIRKLKRREAFAERTKGSKAAMARALAKETT